MLITISLGADFLRWKLNLVDLLILGVALGIDCLVVSFSQGLIFKHNRVKNSVLLALTMGIFQGVMPCISYVFTGFAQGFLEPFKSWVVFSIFMCLGIKFIVEGFIEKEEEICCIGWKCLFGMGLATSIDALASGVNLKLTDTNLIIGVLIIGLSSFFMSLTGFWAGNFFKNLPSKLLNTSGGLILIFLALKAVL